MRQQAMQFAEGYKRGVERLSAYAKAAVRHPSLFVFIGDCAEAAAGIKKSAAEALPGGVFFLSLFASGEVVNLPEAGRAIRMVKTDIQRNETNLNVKRIDLYAVIEAACPDPACMRDAVRLLKDIFTEDFPIVHQTLFILLSESNHWEDYERRAAQSLRTLYLAADIQQSDTLFDLVYVLSDRNEEDVVSEANRQSNYEMIGSLPYLAYTESNFESILRKKSLDAGKAFFVTAGMARLEKPDNTIAYAVFRHVFDYLLEKIQSSASDEPITDMDALLEPLRNKATGGAVSDEKLVRDMMSVASRPMGYGQLRGKTLREAEAELWGDGAARFFQANYGAARFYHQDDAPAIIRRYLEQRGLGKAAGTERYALDEAVRGLDKQIEQQEQLVSKQYQSVVRMPLWITNTDTLKRMIAEVYIIRYKIEYLRATRTALLRIAEGLAEYTRYTQRLIEAMAQASKDLAQEKDPGHHIYAYYKQVVNEIISGLAAQHGDDFIFRDAFMGSPSAFIQNPEAWEAEPDLSPLAKRITEFIQKHVMSHHTMRLSFDEDLKQRSQMSPAVYDGAFTLIDEFYRRVMSDAEKQAALAISLQRYDDLIREKYYFGDTDGMLMRYAKQFNEEFNNETTYLLDDASGFKVIRLAGGFTAEGLTRFRVMQQYFNLFTDEMGLS